ncbi:MAG: ferrous iron transport protein B [Pirellulaceae bacterium]|nr:ferrous iron transport protein B [Pirellulaceae bacterium]
MANPTSSLTVALVGNPNTGKSTLFSALCGVPARVGNYPGVTVEKKLGKYRDDSGEVIVVDLPGTYSLSARTMDEMVSVDVLLGRQSDVPKLDVIVAIADATNLERNLYLFTQLRQLEIPIILVLNMWDRVLASSMKVDLAQLSERLGVTVVVATASRSSGIQEIKAAIRTAAAKGSSTPESLFPPEFQAECDTLRDWMKASGEPEMQSFLVQRLLLDIDSAHAQRLSKQPELKELPNRIAEARARLASSGQRVPALETKCRYNWIRSRLAGVVDRPAEDTDTLSDRIDHVLTHRVWGLVIFAAIMFAVFQCISTGASGMMSGIETLQGALVTWVHSWLAPGTLRSLIDDGIIAGVGSVLIFLPQILILFFFIGVLEDCGYMARAAFVMDKLMTKLGLSGKSFLPLMSSFACAVPGIMATRVIENTRDRMITILVAPLMSCSARLPVYILLISFIPETHWLGGWIGLRGVVLFAMHVLGLVVAIPVAWLLKRFFFPGETAAFVMELPSYKLPSPKVVFYRVWERGQSFVGRAGTLIFCTAVLVWAAGYFPGDHTEVHQLTRTIEQRELQATGDTDDELEAMRAQERQLNGALIKGSLLGQAGQAIEPIVKPLGWDWRIGVGVIASFPAREVIIATLGTIYSLGGDVDEEDSGLQDALASSRWEDGRPVYTLPVALSIMVFFALCAQCAATLMVIKRETNSWRWPIFTFVYMTTLAYVGSFITYNLASWVWVG